MTEADAAENVIDRLLLALAAQVAAPEASVLTPDAAEAFADLDRADAERIFGQAGHLVHYGTDTEPLSILIDAITAVIRAEAPKDALFKPGDKVRLVDSQPETVADYDGTWLRQTTFTVRYVGRGRMIDVQSDLTEDYMIATVPEAALERVEG